MEGLYTITPPAGEADRLGAHRVFEDFLTLYQPALTSVEHYLTKVVDETEPTYAMAYEPWLVALRDLMQGAYLIARRIPLPDPASFIEALQMFRFEGAIHLLSDICADCRLLLSSDWAKKFHEHIDMLLFSASILFRQQHEGLQR